MKKHSFVPTLDNRLEDRLVLSTIKPAVTATPLPPANFGGGHVDYTIPIVKAPTGINPRAINFTSYAFHQVVGGINTAFAHYHGNLSYLNTKLTAAAKKIPYGDRNILPVWRNDLTTAAASPATTPGLAKALKAQVYSDLLAYFDFGIGTGFNVLKSSEGFGTDKLLTYNGKVK